MVEVVDRIMKTQEVSDDKFALLEENRTRLEEKLLQSEERQRQQDRTFQVKMWMMMMQGMNAIIPSPSSSVPYRNVCPMPCRDTDNFFPTAYAPSSSPSPSYDYHQASFRFDDNGDH